MKIQHKYEVVDDDMGEVVKRFVNRVEAERFAASNNLRLVKLKVKREPSAYQIGLMELGESPF